MTDHSAATSTRRGHRHYAIGVGFALVLLAGTVAVACKPLPPAAPATFQAHGSVEQIWVTDGVPGATMAVYRGRGHQVASQTVDAKGSALFHGLRPGDAYRVRQTANGAVTESAPIGVMSERPTPPSTALYGQTLQIDPKTNSGYNYITTRDGTKLAAMIRLPGPPDKGPYPTVIEYSGYTPADPNSPQPSTMLAGLMGYATVGINVRGTGCSGGVFDYFEPLQSLDGYDAVETVARQPWVLNHKVGMVGISYPGISQLFVGQTDPPSLAAIAPLSVIDRTSETLYPGGIFNDGFALSWAQDRVHDSKEGGQPWSAQRIANGDQTCIDNQKLRLETPDLIAKIKANQYYTKEVAAPLDPITFVDKIKVPTYLVCQWQDEQTGGHCPELVSHFTGTNQAWFTFTNGTHVDSLDPATFNRWYDFLSLFVAHKAPDMGALRGLAPIIYGQAMGINGVQLPPDPLQGLPSYEQALAAFEALPRVRVLFGNGAAEGQPPGNPVPQFEQGYGSFPVPGTQPQAWYFQPDGALAQQRPTQPGADSYVYDPAARPRTDFSGGTSDAWRALPGWNWTELAAGKAVAYTSPPLATDETMVGTGSVDLWLQANVPDTDLQVTLSEVRPDGQEMYVQNGWLRASVRALNHRDSTILDPVITGYERTARPLQAGRWNRVRVELFPFGHVFHKGSSVRISVEAPGGDRPFWAFDTLPATGSPTIAIARSRLLASRVVLPVVSTAPVPAPLPPCPSLRGEPCRANVPFANSSSPWQPRGHGDFNAEDAADDANG